MESQEAALNATAHHSLQSLACLSNALSAHQTNEVISTTTWNAHARRKTSNTSMVPASARLVIVIIKIQELAKKSVNNALETRINQDLL